MKTKKFTDKDGRKRIFEFRQYSVSPGFEYEAVEIQDGAPRGMVFSVLGDEADINYWTNKLLEKIKKALATKHIKYVEKTDTWSTCNSIIRGQIKWDSSSEGPLIVVDGYELTWDEFAKTMLVYEGFQFILKFIDPSDDVYKVNITGK